MLNDIPTGAMKIPKLTIKDQKVAVVQLLEILVPSLKELE